MIDAVQYGSTLKNVAYPRDGGFIMRLLIIEDDRDAADYLVKAFREVGHVADLAVDGEEGLAHALDGQYDVLIVDRIDRKSTRLNSSHVSISYAVFCLKKKKNKKK